MIDDSRIEQVAVRLMAVPGVQAVALGGSRARGTHHRDSDVDLGVYYDGGLDVDHLQRVAAGLDDLGEAVVAAPGEWGPWVNGGSWLTIDNTPVDLILRDLHRVTHVSNRAVRGEFAFHPQPGHPLGFLDVSYAGEVANGRILCDPRGLIASLKGRLTPYPDALRRSMVENLWQADFLLAAAGKGIAKTDVAYVGLCCATSLMLCAYAWHACAGVWVTNEKGVVPDTDGLPLDTHGFAGRAAAALTRPADPGHLASTIEATRDLVHDTRRRLERLGDRRLPATARRSQPPPVRG